MSRLFSERRKSCIQFKCFLIELQRHLACKDRRERESKLRRKSNKKYCEEFTGKQKVYIYRYKGQSFSPHLISILLIEKRKRQNRKPLSKASNVFFNHPNYTICKFHSLLRVPCDFLISIS